MIKIENIDVYGWEAAIRGMRNPKNSWDRSDSKYEMYVDGEWHYEIGENDLALMKNLSAAGTDHAKFLRMINVTMDITAPLYWWSEYDTYKVGTVANSCSKMHKLLHKPFEMSDFSFDKLAGYKNEVKQFRPVIDEDMVAYEKWYCYDNDYDISNYGRIKHKFSDHYRLLSGSLHKDGYVFVTLHGKQLPVHRLVATAFVPSDIDCDEVNHKDGNKQNNFASNLEWVNRSQNQKHAVDNGLQPRGLTTYNGKFTEEQRSEIKRLWDSGELSKREIAKRFGVSHTCINDITNDKYKYAEKVNVYEEVARPMVDTLNELRDSYFLCENEEGKKKIWYMILQLLPSSYNQKRTVQLNYAVLKNMYFARRNHKLDEWRTFCDMCLTLPYFKEICVDILKDGANNE